MRTSQIQKMRGESYHVTNLIQSITGFRLKSWIRNHPIALGFELGFIHLPLNLTQDVKTLASRQLVLRTVVEPIKIKMHGGWARFGGLI
jgi:hypothetical protein